MSRLQLTTLARSIKPAGVRQMWHCTGTRGSHCNMLQRTTHSSRSHAAKRATHALTQSTEAVQGLTGEVQKAADGPQGHLAGDLQAAGIRAATGARASGTRLARWRAAPVSAHAQQAELIRS